MSKVIMLGKLMDNNKNVVGYRVADTMNCNCRDVSVNTFNDLKNKVKICGSNEGSLTDNVFYLKDKCVVPYKTAGKSGGKTVKLSNLIVPLGVNYIDESVMFITGEKKFEKLSLKEFDEFTKGKHVIDTVNDVDAIKPLGVKGDKQFSESEYVIYINRVDSVANKARTLGAMDDYIVEFENRGNFSALTKLDIKCGNEEATKVNNLIIPSVSDTNKPVSTIETLAVAFRNFEARSSIIPDTVREVNCAAFTGTPITRVKLNEGLRKIEEFGFGLCLEIESAKIPNSVKYIGELAYAGCSSLGAISIPDSVDKIGEDVLAYCYNIKKIVIRDNGGNGCICEKLSTNIFDAAQSINFDNVTIELSKNIKEFEVGDIQGKIGTLILNGNTNVINKEKVANIVTK